MTGSHTSRTRGSSAAFRAISGPMPAGSPAVIAILGFSPGTGTWQISQLEQQPVGHDLRARVAVERSQRAIDRRVRAQRAIRIVRGGEFLELRCEIRVGDHAA